MPNLITTLGPRRADELDLILPHEHVFVDLRTPDTPGHGQAETSDVIALMGPELKRAQAVGVTALVECTPVGVGRRADILKAVSEATGMPLVVPTGLYREPWVPQWAMQASEDEVFDWLHGELTGEIEGSGVQAAWIKLSAGDDGLTAVETKILRAAARAGAATGAVIGSHTIRGRVVADQLDVVEAAGYRPDRFIWIHTQNEPDLDLHLALARRGAWIEYDSIGRDKRGDDYLLGLVQRVLDAGLGHRLLLSHDLGWYDPAQPGGGTPRPYTYLAQTFLPKLKAAGLTDADLTMLTHDNPFNAFAR
ncbi:MAG: esterase [Anaerolineae bacterium]|nr:esterase [Anaerolineae bacterium]